MSSFADHLRAARLAAGITQQEAICRVKGLRGRSEVWSKWESGRKPNPKLIPAIAQAVGVAPEDLEGVWCYCI